MKSKLLKIVTTFLNRVKIWLEEYLLVFVKGILTDIHREFSSRKKTFILSVTLHLILIFFLGYLSFKNFHLKQEKKYQILQVKLIQEEKNNMEQLRKKQLHKVTKKSKYVKKKKRIKRKKKKIPVRTNSKKKYKKVKTSHKTKISSTKLASRKRKAKTIAKKRVLVPSKVILRKKVKVALANKKIKVKKKKLLSSKISKKVISNLLSDVLEVKKNSKKKIVFHKTEIKKKRMTKDLKVTLKEKTSSKKDFRKKRSLLDLALGEEEKILKKGISFSESKELLAKKSQVKVKFSLDKRDKKKNAIERIKSSKKVLLAGTEKKLLEVSDEVKGREKLNIAGKFFTDSSPLVKKELKVGPFTDGLDKAPEISYYVPIEYPNWAQKKGIYGQIMVKLYIGAEGKVSNIKVVKETVGKKLSAYVVSRIRNWRFKPPLKDGRPTNAWVIQTINFQLKNM